MGACLFLGASAQVLTASSLADGIDATSTVGIAVLGDSYSDEYRFEADARSEARNWVEILSLTRGLDFGTSSDRPRDEPRRAGFAYNWARSAATTRDMLAQGQHTGAARDVEAGRVGIVVVFVGGNDFIDWLEADNPQLSASELSRQACANVDTAIRAILGASDRSRVILVTVPDLLQMPELEQLRTSGRLGDEPIRAARAGLERFNEHLLSWPRRCSRLSAADFAGMSRLGTILSPDTIPVGEIRLRRHTAGLEVDSAFLPDGRHAGTLLQGLLAQLILTSINRQLEPKADPLSGLELVRMAEELKRVHPPVAAPLAIGASPSGSLAAP